MASKQKRRPKAPFLISNSGRSGLGLPATQAGDASQAGAEQRQGHRFRDARSGNKALEEVAEAKIVARAVTDRDARDTGSGPAEEVRAATAAHRLRKLRATRQRERDGVGCERVRLNIE